MSFLRSVIADARSGHATPSYIGGRDAFDNDMVIGMNPYTHTRDSFVGERSSPPTAETGLDASATTKPGKFNQSGPIDINLSPDTELEFNHSQPENPPQPETLGAVSDLPSGPVRKVDNVASENPTGYKRLSVTLQDDVQAEIGTGQYTPEPGIDRELTPAVFKNIDFEVTRDRIADSQSIADQLDLPKNNNPQSDELGESLSSVSSTEDLAFISNGVDAGAHENEMPTSVSVATILRVEADSKSPRIHSAAFGQQDRLATSDSVRPSAGSNLPVHRVTALNAEQEFKIAEHKQPAANQHREATPGDKTDGALLDMQPSEPSVQSSIQVTAKPVFANDTAAQAAPSATTEKVVSAVQISRVLPQRYDRDTEQRSSSNISQPGEVKIGQVDVFIQAPKTSTASPSPRPRSAFASRHFLRRL